MNPILFPLKGINILSFVLSDFDLEVETMTARISLVLLVSCGIIVAGYQVKENCGKNGSEDCHIFSWRSWGSCNGVCGHQTRSRERVFCCSLDVHPHDLENCLAHCNFTNNFESHQNQTCIVCEHGDMLSSLTSTCKCGSHFKGDCCQGRKHFLNIFLK